MTLPDSEMKRIEEQYPFVKIMNMDLQISANRQGAEKEALLWYERMGKFAEMQGKIWIGDCIWSFDRVF